jgi:hypothetical protein
MDSYDFNTMDRDNKPPTRVSKEKQTTEPYRVESYNANNDKFNTLERERRVTDRQVNEDKLKLDQSEIKSMQSFLDDNLSIKPYSDYNNLNFDDLKSKNEEKVNNSMMENLKKSHLKRPPLPGGLGNLYKTADKNFLNKIQKILKNKDTKKLNYATSEDEN